MQRALTLPLVALLCGASLAQTPPPAPVVREGRIRDVLGEPIVGARVEAHRDGRVIARSASDAEGIYLLRVPPGSELRFTASGRETVQLPWRGEAAPRVQHVVLEDAVAVRGFVRDADGAPAAGACLVLLTGNRSHCTTTDAEGRFTLDGVPMRAATVFVRSDAGACEQALHVRDDCRLELVLQRPRGAMCRVHVQGLPPAALASASLRVFGADPLALHGGRLPLRGDGTAELGVASMILVQATADGFVGAPSTCVVDRGARELTFMMRPTPAPAATLVRGKLATTLGRPRPGVRVFVRDRSHRDLGSVTTGRDGTFRLPLPLGDDRMLRCGVAIADGLLDDANATLHDNCSWLLGNRDGVLELFVEPSVPVQADVRLPDGSALALAELLVADARQPHRTLLHTSTDRAGIATFGLPVGVHELLAIGHDGAVCTATLDVRQDGAQPVRWQRVETGEIAGTLCDAAGAPLPGVELLLAHEALQGPGAARSNERQRATVVTDRSGAFRCRGIPTGNWTLATLHATAGTNDVCVVQGDAQAIVALRHAGLGNGGAAAAAPSR